MTTLTFDDARIQNDNGVWLCLKVAEPAPAKRFVIEKKNRLYDLKITQHREKRSLDANAYFWTLCDKLAAETGQRKIDIYRSAIRDIGGNNDTICVQSKAEKKLRQAWEHNGIGWITDSMPSKIPGCVNVVLYYGSSTYDSAQMARLIDNIVQDCQTVGVETLQPDKLALLKEDWDNAPTN